MKKVLLLLVSAMCLTANAQELKYGVTAGVNVNSPEGNMDSGSRLGYHIGGTATCDFSKWYASASLLLTQKGFKRPYTLSVDNQEIKSHTDVTYLELPIVAGKNFNLGGGCKFFMEAGPYIAVGLFGKSQTKWAGVKEESHKVFGKNGFKRFDAGLTGGIGVEAFKHLRMKVGYEFGIPNLAKRGLAPAELAPTYRNRTLTVSASYIF